MTDDLNAPVGAWRAIGNLKIKEAVWPEGVLALVIGVAGSVLVIGATTPTERASTMGDVLVLAGAFLAVVFTALAIMVALPPGRYLRMLGETRDGGMRGFLDPFLVAVGTQITIVLFAVGYRLLASDVTKWVEHVAFGVIGFIFVYGLLDIGALARQLVRHGILRAADAALGGNDDEGADRSVRQLPGRRG